jgi:hypothetical protein
MTSLSRAHQDNEFDFEPTYRSGATVWSTATDQLVDLFELSEGLGGGTLTLHTGPVAEFSFSETVLEFLRLHGGQVLWTTDEFSTAPTQFAIGGRFAAVDHLRTPEGQLERLIASLAGSRLPYAARLASRLTSLLRVAEEEEQPWTEQSVESLRRMIMFLESARRFGYPTVTVTPAGTFRAQWTTARDEHFALEFLSDGRVRFVVFARDPRHPERIRQASGVSNWDTVLADVGNYRVHDWAARAGS